MANAYADVATLKSASALNLPDDTHDAALRSLLEAASRWIDGYCGRHFYAASAQRQFDGNGGTLLPTPDLISVSRLRTRAPGGVWQDWPAASWLPYPLDAAPHTRLAASSGRGRRFPAGRATVAITGIWGYGSARDDTGLQIASGTTFTIGDTAATLSPAGNALSAGHTIRIDDEDLYIAAASVSKDDNQVTLTLRRGVNGTTAAAHTPGTAASVYRYPPPVAAACRRIAATWWLERTLAPLPSSSSSPSASSASAAGIDPAAQSLLQPFRRRTATLGV